MDAKEFLLDCRGKACPRPVIETKKALADKGAVCTLVDNEIAVQNLQKMAAHVGAASEVEKRGDDFAVHVTPGAAPAAAADEQALPAAPASGSAEYSLSITGNPAYPSFMPITASRSRMKTAAVRSSLRSPSADLHSS